MFVILTSKPGQFRTEAGEGLRPMESWDYELCGRLKAHFVIAEIDRAVKVTVVDETPPEVVNHIPSKFLPSFASVEEARREIAQLARYGDADNVVVRRS